MAYNLKEILTLDDEIHMKFSLIQRCADFLDELDDFDKLALLFVYDSPTNFDLEDIMTVISIQMKRPKEMYQSNILNIILL
jgi:hypothetical protein